ncbi:MAG: 50S ribosomal protein L22 [Elusimicrobiota bacterium]
MVEAVAHSRFARYGPRKVGQVLGLIRRKNAQRALTALAFAPRRSSVLVIKTLESALGNLGVKLGKKVEPREVWVTECWVNGGPFIKRIHPGSMGRAMPFKRKTCHLTIKVADQL